MDQKVEQTATLLSSFITKTIDFAPTIALALATLLIGFWVISWITKAVNLALNKKGVDNTIAPFLSSILSVGLKVMLLLSVAGMFGIQTTSFIAIFTALAFAIGSALSGSLSHFASGVMILIFKPYKVGDLVTVAGETGTVEAIQVFNTTLLTLQNKRIIIPNANITAGTIVNISGQGTIRVDLDLILDSTANIDQARTIILKVMESNPMILKDPAPGVVVSAILFGHIKLSICPWAKSADYWPVFFYMQEEMKKELEKAGVPFPKVDDLGHLIA